MQEYCIKTSSNICFGYLLESPQWGDSKNIQSIMFYEEIRIKQGISYISFCPIRILYNNKFILKATSVGTNAVVVTRVHCTSMYYAVSNVGFCKRTDITKTCLFKYIVNFTTKNENFQIKNSDIFSYFCSKHRLWVLVRTASPRRF